MHRGCHMAGGVDGSRATVERLQARQVFSSTGSPCVRHPVVSLWECLCFPVLSFHREVSSKGHIEAFIVRQPSRGDAYVSKTKLYLRNICLIFCLFNVRQRCVADVEFHENYLVQLPCIVTKLNSVDALKPGPKGFPDIKDNVVLLGNFTE